MPETIDGPGVVEMTIPSVPMLPGPYQMTTEITGYHRGHIYDHIQGAVKFDVLPGAVQETTGLVTVNPSWTIDQ